MCGIMGYVGKNDCVGFLINGLKRLEYRGYDSSGVAAGNSSFTIVKSEGKIENIERILETKPLKGTIGIGHTRWATHGKPNSVNAHPHRTGSTVLVHNGIIENYEPLRAELIEKGYQPISETDSELFGHLVEEQLKQGLAFEEAVRTAFLQLEGSCSIVVVNDKFPDRIVAVKNGTPMVVAHSASSGGSFVASDAQAIIEHTRDVTFLENEDFVVCTKEGFSVHSLKKPLGPGSVIKRDSTVLDWALQSLDKAGYPHYMLKEIHEQPRAILDTLDNLVERETAIPRMEGLRAILQNVRKVQIVACGTAWHAGLVGKYILEQIARLPVEVDLASEYRYREPIVGPDTLFLAVTQSGETADTLAALREAKRQGAMTAAICNVRGSSIAREAGFTMFTAAGPEIGVASTKAFTTQILVLMMLGQYVAHFKHIEEQGSIDHPKLDLHFFLKLPHLIQGALDTEKKIAAIAKRCIDSPRGFFFLGRGRLYPNALEGALKMKEISYIHAEGYPAGEMKHGPIAMVDAGMTIVVLAPRDGLFDKTVSNLQEVKARGGRIVAIGNRGDDQLFKLADEFLEYDFADDFSDVLVAAIPLQLLAYHTAVLRGTDIDKPRNLAKSVTVE